MVFFPVFLLLKIELEVGFLPIKSCSFLRDRWHDINFLRTISNIKKDFEKTCAMVVYQTVTVRKISFFVLQDPSKFDNVRSKQFTVRQEP